MKLLTGAQVRYCAKVGIAAALGYLLTQGNLNQYAVYSAFAAALIVGTSVGEDLASSGNRVKGTLAGMAAAVIVTAMFGPNVLSVGLGVVLTAVVALACGWGIPVARIGVTVCIITLVAHDDNALDYDLYRTFNTLIGVVAGLAVSFFVWPVRSRHEIVRASNVAMTAALELLDAVEANTELAPVMTKLYDKLHDVVKFARDAKLEKRMRLEAGEVEARGMAAMRLGVEALAVALDERRRAEIPDLRRRIQEFTGTVSA